MRSDSASTHHLRYARFISPAAVAYHWLSATIAIVLALAPATVAAQPSATGSAAARTLYTEGLQLQRDGNWDEACPKFEEAYRIEKRVASGYHIAECHEHYGRTASAWALFADMVTLATQQDRENQATEAQAKVDELLPKLLKLRVVVAEASDDVKVTITRAGTLLYQGRSDVAIPIDSGVCDIEVTAADHLPATRQVDVQGEGTTISETFAKLEPLTAPEPIVAPPPVTAAPPPAAAPLDATPVPLPQDDASDKIKSGSQQRLAGVIVGSAGLATVGVGAVFGLITMSKTSAAEEHCPTRDACYDPGADLMDEAAVTANVSTTLFAVGGAALAAGVITYFTAPSDAVDEARSRASRFSLVPLLNDKTQGLGIHGTW